MPEKLLLPPLVLLLVISICCSKDHHTGTTNHTPPLNEVQQYFFDVAFGNEFGTAYTNLRKWQQDIYIYVPNSSLNELNEELNKIIKELDSLQTGIVIKRVTDSAQSNYIVYIGNSDTYVTKYEPAAAPYVADNYGLFYIYWDDDYTITRGSMYIDIVRTAGSDCRKHLLREELTQSLGLMNDSYTYPESIFYQPWTCGDAYAPVDVSLIQYLYNPRLKAGMTKEETETIIETL